MSHRAAFIAAAILGSVGVMVGAHVLYRDYTGSLAFCQSSHRPSHRYHEGERGKRAMTTARDVIAKAICETNFSPCDCEPAPYCDQEVKTAQNVINALLSAPESTRLELAALLNPWRPIEEAPKDTPIQMFAPAAALLEPPFDPADFDIRISTTRNWCWATKWCHAAAPPSEDKT